MAKMRTSEAIILKAYNIGSADRFCVLLTESHGRETSVAKGVRKLGSKLSGALQSFQHVRIDLSEHSSGSYVHSAECIQSFPSIRSDLSSFNLASRGAELLLNFLHDTEPAPAIFQLALEYFTICDAMSEKYQVEHFDCAQYKPRRSLLFPAFQIMLMKELGILPPFRNQSTSTKLHVFFTSSTLLTERSSFVLSDNDQRQVREFCTTALRDHLSFPLRSEKVCGMC